MEIVQYFENKTVFISGVTGFLAKLFLEKILRIQPKVKKIFVLIRATPEKSVEQRLHDEVMSVELFRVVKEEFDSNGAGGLLEKVVPISGDVSLENLGIIESRVREEIWRDVDIIVNSAATTRFDERYDVALGVNALGGMHVQHFATKCCKLKMLLHVSTAYVHGTRAGVIPEVAFHMGQTLPGAEIPYLDINREKKIVEERLRQLHTLNSTPKQITSAMKDLGIERAKLHGWPNTYAFTKAMGEMMILEEMKGKDYKLIILRPTIITSTYKEPFPGWIEGLRTLDAIFVAYGKRDLTVFLADPQSIIDMIPGDMVVNAMFAAIARHSNNQPSPNFIIYHVGSSKRNPIYVGDVRSIMHQYLRKKPFLDNRGKPIRMGAELKLVSSMTSFHRHIKIRYLPFLKILKLLNLIFCHKFERSYTNSSRAVNYRLRLVELYKPFSLFLGTFDDANTENLRMTTREYSSSVDMFGFDPKCIQWEEYFINTHFPGVVNYALK
ncbi:fatty acyl-CoA reductase 3-like isoform X2 [Sesamum indicum]|uniref:Fatty acyl-CoA reductase n=1 Tax=Sesamum indicum TaxID=4182 RepID=A0A8M8V8A8_SESIN|nr:fatty acyl-CoA reductase 3-like isoform X2 [Sesamum indicum]